MDKGALADIGFMRAHLGRVEHEIRKLQANNEALTRLLKIAVEKICAECECREEEGCCERCLWKTWWKAEGKEPEGDEKA